VQILFRLRDLPPGDSNGDEFRGRSSNDLVGLVREVDCSKEHRILATENGVVTAGTLSALSQIRIRASVSNAMLSYSL
jgi:hypothetical protein